jgi:hypothetical protein
MSDIRIDDDGFLVGDGEQQRTEAENVLIQEIKTDTTAIVNLLKGTVKLQRDALKAAQSAASPKPKGGNNNVNSGAPSRVNLVHPNRSAPTPTPNNAPIPPTVRPNRQGAGGNPTPTPTPNNGANAGSPPDTARPNRQRGANGRFTSEGAPSDSSGAPASGNRDSRGRFTGGNGANAAERSATSRITDGLKDLNNTLTVNANTDRIDPMVDAIKEAGSVISTGVDASKKVLSVGNTLIAKPAMALGRGIKGLFKPKTDVINSPASWYKRIWRTLVQGNRQDHADHNQEQRRLDEIARGQGSGGGSGNSSLLMVLGLGLAGLLSAIKNIKIPSLDELTKKFKELGTDNESPIPIKRIPKLPTPTLPPTRFQSWMTKLGESKAGKALGAFAKKIPYISSALEAGAGGINAVNIANDENLTDAQKERAQSANAGATTGAIGGGLGGTTAGMAAGGLIGTAIFPGVGTAIGTVVGGLVGSWLGTEGGRIVGEKVGGWVDDLANADIAGRISNAWTAFVTPLTPMFAEIKSWTVSTWQKTQDTALGMWESVTIDAKATWSTITSGWDGLIASVSAGFESIANAATAFNTWFKDKTGIDIGENLTRSKDAVVDAASRNVVEPVVETAKGMGESLAINAKANTEKLKENAASLGQGVKDAPLVRFLGSIGEGLGGAAFELTQPTDKEKAKKATKTKKATSKQELNEKGYSAYNDVLEAAYSKNGFNDPQSRAFLKGQIQAESNFNPNAKSPAGAFGISQFMPDTAKQYKVMSGDSPEAVKSQAEGQTKYMQYLLKRYNGDWEKALAGYNTGEGNLDKKLKAAKEKGVDWKTLLPQETKDYLVNVKQNAMNFGAVSASQVATVTPKAITTPKANTPTNTVPTLKTAPVTASPVPNVQSVQSVQAKEQPTRHNTSPTPIKVSFAKPLVGQNVSDRGIAHILTGGIGETA